MDDIGIQELMRAKYSGAISAYSQYMTLIIQTVAVLVGGIVLWRMSNYIHKRKKQERERNSFFETPYSKGWKRY
jgi:hypothetical protein